MPYVAFYPSDWLAGTRGLTAAETGVYITLVAMMYELGGPLDMDDARLARLCGSSVPAFQKAVKALVSEGKITRTDAGLFNNRVGAELKKRAEKCAGAAANANARWQKAKEKQATNDADAMQTQCETDAIQIHNQNKKEDNPPTPRKRGGEPDGFEAFWAAYPRKVAKGAARKAWVAALRKSDAATITAAAAKVEDRGEFTPHPSTWLNAERWADGGPPVKPKEAPSSAPKAFAEAVRDGREYLIRFHERNDAVVRQAIRDHGLTIEELRRVGVSPPAGSFPMRVA